jgi:hypothetical protein
MQQLHKRHCPGREPRSRERKPLLDSSEPNVCDSLPLASYLFLGAFSRQGLLHPTFRPRFQVIGMPLDLFDDVLRLDLALESSQGILDGLTLL